MTYLNGLRDVIELKKYHPELRTVLHSDQGSVYASKSFNELLPSLGIIRSMSRSGTPTDNGAMESINGWIKEELMKDFHVTGESPIEDEIDELHFSRRQPHLHGDLATPSRSFSHSVTEF